MNGEPSSVAPAPGSEQEKLYWEVEKLKREVASLGRPWYRQFGALFGTVSAVVAVFGVLFQWQASSIKYEQATLKVERTQKEIAKLQEDELALRTRQSALEQRVKDLQERENRLRVTTEAMEQQLAAVKVSLATAQGEAPTNARLAGALKRGAAQLETLGQNAETLQTIAQPYTQEAPRGASSLLRGYTIGVYFRQGSAADAEVAERVVRYLAERRLGATVKKTARNEQFFVTVQPPEGNEVRYEEAGETEAAQALLAVLKDGNFSPPFRLRPVQNRTPYFLSLFVSSR
jgi:hypothetical protein